MTTFHQPLSPRPSIAAEDRHASRTATEAAMDTTRATAKGGMAVALPSTQED
jgi:hypothetical protein